MRKMFKVLFWVALVLGVLIGLARLTVLRWWRVPTDDAYLTASISPTLRGGDLILLWRLSKPGFGDLVLCPEPKHPGRVVIGRLVGEPRDEIELLGSEIVVNRVRQKAPVNCGKFDENAPDTGIPTEQYCSEEDLGGVTHLRGELTSKDIRPPDLKTTVPNGQVWLVSDNRQFPYDSREFGPVDRASCEESVFFRLIGKDGFLDTSRRNQIVR